ncbi:MAG: SDR family NAD(P)-dependent oxidoreductase [Opitutaceae bacterium]|nr:SDR family NAD(P)-dependent oxidoreductase [Opitutaceae bacterium]
MSHPKLSSPPRTAWVSGATSGLGEALVRALLSQQVRVWGTARDISRLSKFSEARTFVPVCMDLEEERKAVASFVQADREAQGFDLVIHNAGFGVFGPFALVPASQWVGQVGAMVTTLVHLNHLGFSRMLKRGSGTLVNVSSVAVEHPLPFMAGYNAAKAALSALSESLMFEARGTRVQVIDFRPADLRTDFNGAMRRPDYPPVEDPRVFAAWSALTRNLERAPMPECAVKDLWRGVDRGRSGTIYSGSFFQARLAPTFAKLAPQAIRRAVAARYFGVS